VDLHAAKRNYLRPSTWGVPFELWLPVLYALIAAIWIYSSDTVASWLAQTPEQMRLLQTYKGWFYVAFTAFLLYGFLQRTFSRMRKTQQELTRSDEALRQKERMTSVILDSISELFLYQTPDHRIIWANRAAGESMRMSPEDLKGRYCYTLWGQQEQECEYCPFPLVLESRMPYGKEICSPDGRHWDIRGYPINNPDGTVEGLVEVVLDITDRKRAENALRESEAKFRTLSETLEQRVTERTALAEQRAIQLRALALQMTQAEQKERRRIAHILHEHFQQLLVAAKFHVDRLRRHPDDAPTEALQKINDTLNEAIRSSRSLTVELSPPILYDVGLTQALCWLARWMQERYGLQVTATVDPAAEPAEEDLRVMLFTAVRELLLNVVKHAGVAAASIEMTCQHDELRILVSDAGKGFAPSHCPQQTDLTAGYGLFSIRERLHQIGGRLQIDSAPGAGTQACITVSARLQQKSA
jgi:PAS domain S-box-containing protein